MSKSSMLRTNPNACPLAVKCGGCQLQNMTYDRQLKWKQVREEILLRRFGKVEEIIGADEPCAYRNKTTAAFALSRGGKAISGVYQSGSHSVVPTDECMTEDRASLAIIADIRRLLSDFKLTVYDRRTERGVLRHVLVRRGFFTGEVMVVLAVKSAKFPLRREFAEKLVSLHPEIKTVVMNVSPGKVDLVLGERDEVLFGDGFITDVLCGMKFRISPRSFYQINHAQTEKLYALAMEMAELDGTEKVIDAYCGIGTIGLVAAKNVGAVIGVESNPDAVRDAEKNAKLNCVENAVFFCEDAGKYLEDAASRGEKCDVLFMDPPRAGSSKKFIESVAVMRPEKVVYISCNPETLARDLSLFTRRGYKTRRIVPVDMFPQTNHVETVVLMSRDKE